MNIVMDPQRQMIAATPGLFLLNAGNKKYVSSEAARIGNSTTMFIIAAIFIAAAIGVAVFFGGQLLSSSQLDQSGVTDTAKVIDKRTSTSRRSTSYYISYQFTANGNTYTREQSVDRESYLDLDNSDVVTIKYLASDPNVSELAGRYADSTERTSSTIGLAILLPICLGIAGLILLTDNTNRKLSNLGQLLQGQIVSAVGRAGSKGAYNVTVEYSFTTPDGRQITKKQVGNRPDLRKNPMPAPGTPVAVLYVDDKLQRLM